MMLRRYSGMCSAISTPTSVTRLTVLAATPTSWPRPPRMATPPITTAAMDWNKYGSPMPSAACPPKPTSMTPAAAENRLLSAYGATVTADTLIPVRKLARALMPMA